MPRSPLELVLGGTPTPRKKPNARSRGPRDVVSVEISAAARDFADEARKVEAFLYFLNQQHLDSQGPSKRTGAEALVLELLVSKLIDNFQAYLVEALRAILKAKPEALKNRDVPLTAEYVLGFATREELVDDLIEKRVSTVSMMGFPSMVDWFEGQGFGLSMSSSDRAQATEMIATRNCLVHNRGRIDRRYLTTVRASNFRLGQKRPLDFAYLLQVGQVVARVVEQTDARFREKFGLPTVELRL